MKNKNVYQYNIRLWTVLILLLSLMLTSVTWAGVSDHTLQDIIFIQRYPFISNHWYTDFINGTFESFMFRTDNGIYKKDVQSGTKTAVITASDMSGLTGSNNGIFYGFDVSYDATKVVFDYKPTNTTGFRIYECNIDGTGLRQITPDSTAEEAAAIARYDLSGIFPEETGGYNHHWDDMHPCYTPDDKIIFTSTRCMITTLCDMDGIFTTPVLYRIDLDGTNMEKLSDSPVSEFAPTTMEDGRILYTRWEYVDKGSVNVKTLTTMQPDGTNTNEVWGLDTETPPTVNYGRQVPGRPDLYAAVATDHFIHGNNPGGIILINTNKDTRIPENGTTPAPAVTYVTPDVRVTTETGWDFWTGNNWTYNDSGSGGRLYTTPYPLDEETFLVSCKYSTSAEFDEPDVYDIYMIDTAGNHQLVHGESSTSCWAPQVLAPREKPVVINSFRIPSYADQNQAVCIVTDVYRGMTGVAPGAVKYLRVNIVVPRPWASDKHNLWGANHLSSTNWPTRLWVQAQCGIVPVETDGSAHFIVPADRNIFLQALDENYMEIQRERTYFLMRPGEVRSCVGCHERRGETSPAIDGTPPIALQSPPVIPGPMPGETSDASAPEWNGWGCKVIQYPADIQPIFDAKCTSCHDGSPSPNLSGTVTDRASQSYEQLCGIDVANSPHVGYLFIENINAMIDAFFLPPYSLGAHTSSLITKLRTGHPAEKGSTAPTSVELNSIIRWVDSNAQYYGTFFGRHSGVWEGHANFRVDPTFEEAISPDAPSWHN